MKIVSKITSGNYWIDHTTIWNRDKLVLLSSHEGQDYKIRNVSTNPFGRGRSIDVTITPEDSLALAVGQWGGRAKLIAELARRESEAKRAVSREVQDLAEKLRAEEERAAALEVELKELKTAKALRVAGGAL